MNTLKIIKAGIGQWIIVNQNGGMAVNRYFDHKEQAERHLENLTNGTKQHTS